ncbi:hypothetical protein L226DRAFT_616254 [Lentinus tigrinus ALCF2SS1-7]|uniref:uncharacterized protein n=1 Tax=Lentinus tigrinus ALCF2SS1-7 TaxID=1328758 RepID=UPI00116625C1|nr:hypothetical protein L226DRAFT_616254 [Lentinus tigrinus ALCF2SS1-7]
MDSVNPYLSESESAFAAGLSEQLQAWLDAEQLSIWHHGEVREYLPEGECEGRRVNWYDPSPAHTPASARQSSPSPSTTSVASSVETPPTTDTLHTADAPHIADSLAAASDDGSSRESSPSPSPSTTTPPLDADTPPADSDSASNSDDDGSTSQASTPASEGEEPHWEPVSTVKQYIWQGQILPPMTADDLWYYLKDEQGVLKHFRADRKVKCHWPDCGEWVDRGCLRRHVRYTHQGIKKCCTNAGCSYVDREDNFANRHKCRHGASGVALGPV